MPGAPGPSLALSRLGRCRLTGTALHRASRSDFSLRLQKAERGRGAGQDVEVGGCRPRDTWCRLENHWHSVRCLPHLGRCSTPEPRSDSGCHRVRRVHESFTGSGGASPGPSQAPGLAQVPRALWGPSQRRGTAGHEVVCFCRQVPSPRTAAGHRHADHQHRHVVRSGGRCQASGRSGEGR